MLVQLYAINIVYETPSISQHCLARVALCSLVSQIAALQVLAHASDALIASMGSKSSKSKTQEALLMPDLRTLPGARAPVVCIDIKPKAGFLPTDAAIHPDKRIKHRVCRYQLHQTLKVHQVSPDTLLNTMQHAVLPVTLHASKHTHEAQGPACIVSVMK